MLVCYECIKRMEAEGQKLEYRHLLESHGPCEVCKRSRDCREMDVTRGPAAKVLVCEYCIGERGCIPLPSDRAPVPGSCSVCGHSKPCHMVALPAQKPQEPPSEAVPPKAQRHSLAHSAAVLAPLSPTGTLLNAAMLLYSFVAQAAGKLEGGIRAKVTLKLDMAEAIAVKSVLETEFETVKKIAADTTNWDWDHVQWQFEPEEEDSFWTFVIWADLPR